jgi:hypothetical protein
MNSSNDHRFAQAHGEIRDVSANLRRAPQQFVTRCVFFATFLTLSADGLCTLYAIEKRDTPIGYVFSI